VTGEHWDILGEGGGGVGDMLGALGVVVEVDVLVNNIHYTHIHDRMSHSKFWTTNPLL
jgi:hypothetical protein